MTLLGELREKTLENIGCGFLKTLGHVAFIFADFTLYSLTTNIYIYIYNYKKYIYIHENNHILKCVSPHSKSLNMVMVLGDPNTPPYQEKSF